MCQTDKHVLDEYLDDLELTPDRGRAIAAEIRNEVQKKSNNVVKIGLTKFEASGSTYQKSVIDTRVYRCRFSP